MGDNLNIKLADSVCFPKLEKFVCGYLHRLTYESLLLPSLCELDVRSIFKETYDLTHFGKLDHIRLCQNIESVFVKPSKVTYRTMQNKVTYNVDVKFVTRTKSARK